MSGWHREHPELVGTDADPWSIHPGYQASVREARMYQQFPDLDNMIARAEADSTHVCRECPEVQGAGDGTCRTCGGPLTEREP